MLSPSLSIGCGGVPKPASRNNGAGRSFGTAFGREPVACFGVYRNVFEQSILLDHNANKPWNFLASLSAELVVVSLVLLIPLAFRDHLPAVHWKDIVMSPPPAPIPYQPPPSTRPATAGAVSPIAVARPVFRFVPGADTRQVQTAPAFSTDAPPSIGSFVPGSIGSVGALPMTTPALPPPPRPEPHPATQSAPIRVGGDVQMAKLIRKVIPEYPIARQDRPDIGRGAFGWNHREGWHDSQSAACRMEIRC